MVAQYVDEKQNDWDNWIPWAMYAYNGARHGTTGYSPNELMMGRRLRAPNELLRASRVQQIEGWPEYHRKLVTNMESAAKIAKQALEKDQLRRERYYSHKVRNNVRFKVGDMDWIFRPPRGTGVTKLAHQWIGPAKITADGGFDNWIVRREDTKEELVAHCSFLVSYY
ncbi:hypothetical protein PHMEG_00038661 [Phytophthora megakarya]|uniref:Integrase catalytic domain-containing protein n=1 Tax=Phytophthora megakarya TaxID=4795 RepID=A0A225UHF6_9STRA|nr:hypothetical protein PHMEG_00038661 [Phytophthora megakarya]